MRVSINLSQEMLDRVDQEAKRIGTSRGAMLTTWIGEKVSQIDNNRQLAQSLNKDLVLQLAAIMKDQLMNPDPHMVDAVVSAAADRGLIEEQTQLFDGKEKS